MTCRKNVFFTKKKMRKVGRLFAEKYRSRSKQVVSSHAKNLECFNICINMYVIGDYVLSPINTDHLMSELAIKLNLLVI
jgi:hypothetical protein